MAMSLLRRQFLQLAAGVVASPAVSLLAHAQAYPSRSVRVIVPVGPGGQNDTIVRLVAQKLSENLGQSYYVENQGGGSGNIGMGAAARAPADGYTILAAGGNFVINASLYAKIPYDPVADFTPVTMLCSSPHVLAVHPSVPAVSVKELVALAQADPGKLSYASAGRGTPAHLAGELFRLAFGVDVTHVPFSGGGQAITSTIGGHTSMAVSAVPTAAPYIRGGNVRALAVMSATRTSVLPGVPTMAEAGRPLEADIVTGLLVRAGTPREIVELLHREVARVMAAPEIRERLVTLGFEPVAGSPEEFAAWIRNEIAKWANVIRDANITPQ
ncbi:MAG: Bug family tripartite tricarboxylate transporter substrate binding protein [Xanthobacteraceae bacterium]